jgi:hypothetical protein
MALLEAICQVTDSPSSPPPSTPPLGQSPPQSPSSGDETLSGEKIQRIHSEA